MSRALFIAALVCATPALAQQFVVAPSSSYAQVDAASPLPSDEGRSQTDASAIVQHPGQQVGDTPRRLVYSAQLTMRVVADDNIGISSFHPVSDTYFTIEPIISFGIGTESGSLNSLNFVYRPSLYLFEKTSSNDNVQQLIHLQASHQFGNLGLSVVEDIQLLDGSNLNSLSDPTGHQANIDVGARARQEFYTTSLGYSYNVSDKVFISGSAAYAINTYEQASLISSKNYYANLFLNYLYSPKLTVGLGGTWGYNTTSNNSSADQTFEQANVRLSYSPTAKTSLSGSVGAEFRQTGGYSSDPSLVFELTAAYAPFDGTSISLNGHRRTENSAVLAGQDYSETALVLSLQQRFLQRVYLGLAAGYTNSEYFSTVQSLNASRSDDYIFLEPSVDLNVTRFWSVGAYYLYRKDTSSFAFYSFDDNQFGLRTTLTF